MPRSWCLRCCLWRLRSAGPLGIAGGFMLGAVNALLVGATLRLIEQSLNAARTITIQDVSESFGHYFWDVIGVGFVLWLPTMLSIWAPKPTRTANFFPRRFCCWCFFF